MRDDSPSDLLRRESAGDEKSAELIGSILKSSKCRTCILMTFFVFYEGTVIYIEGNRRGKPSAPNGLYSLRKNFKFVVDKEKHFR